MVGDIRAAFRKAHIPLEFDAGLTKGDTVAVKVTDAGRMDEARTLLQTAQSRRGHFGAGGRRQAV